MGNKMRKSFTISKLSLYQRVSCPMWVPELHLRSCVAHALQGKSLTHSGMSATLNYCKCPANRNHHCRKRWWCSLVLLSWGCCACTRCVAGSKRSNRFSAVFLRNCASVRVGLPQAGDWPADTIKVVPIGEPCGTSTVLSWKSDLASHAWMLPLCFVTFDSSPTVFVLHVLRW